MEPLKKMKLRVYRSFAEANDGDDREAAALSPIQHLANAMALIKNLYGYKGGPSKHRRITQIGYAKYSN